MIEVVKWHFEDIFCFLTNRKCDFYHVDEATIQVDEWLLKEMTFNLFSASGTAQNATLVN